MSKGFFILMLCFCLSKLSFAQHLFDNTSTLKKEIAGLHGESSEKVDKLNRLAAIERDRNIDSLYKYASGALEMSGRIGYDKGIATSKGFLSFFYYMKGNEYLAFKSVNEALEIARTLNDKELESLVLIDISLLSARRGLSKQAREYSEQAFQLSDNFERDSLKSAIFLNYGFINKDQLSKSELLDLADRARAFAVEHKDSLMLVQVEHFRAQVNIWKGGDLEESKALFKKAIAKIEHSKDGGHFNVQNYYGLGDAFSKTDPDSAVFYYDLGMKVAMDYGLENLSMYGRTKVYEILRERDNQKASAYSEEILEFQRKFGEMNDSERLNYLEILIKEKNLKIEEARLQTRKILFGGIVIFSLAVLAVAVYVWKLYRDKKRLSEELTITNSELDDKHQFSEKIIAVLAHDLRQPFASILMVHELVDRDSFGLEDCKTVLYQMRLISEKSIQTLEGLLEWTKYNGLGLRFEAKRINLKASIASGVKFNSYDLEDKNLNVDVHVDEGIDVHAQSEMLLFLNRNIVSNAVKYTPRGGKISITARMVADGNAVEVCIKDNGKGISKEVLERLFNESNTASFSSQQVKGAGVAMIICQDMVGKMGGKIRAENNTGEPGASFFYQLNIFAKKDNAGDVKTEERQVEASC